MINFWYNLSVLKHQTKFKMEDKAMKIMSFLGMIWEFVMKILINAGVEVEGWTNPFDAFVA